MHLPVTVVPNADADRVEKRDGRLHIWTQAPAEDGKANAAILDLVRKYLSTKGPVRIVSGHKQRQKVVEIPDN